MPKCKNRRCNSVLQDDFIFCPYCGKNQKDTKSRGSRRPNGTGSVYQRIDMKSKPWAAASSVTGKQVYLGLFPTRTDAIRALSEYEANPVTAVNCTLEKLHADWIKSKGYAKLGESVKCNYKTSWDKLKPLHKRKVRELRTSDLQAIIDYYEAPHQKAGTDGKLMYIDEKGKHTYKKSEKPYMIDGLKFSALNKIKCLLGKLYTFALKNDIVLKNYAAFLELPPPNETEKTTFNDFQLEIVRRNIENVPYADYILAMCYLNFRVSEFLELTAESYHVSDTGIPVFIGGKKTEAGTDRLVPIHPKVLPIVKKCLAKNGETIFCDENGKAMNKDRFREMYFYPALDKLGLPRTLTPHSCRRTFSTRMSAAGARQEDIIALMGHTSFETDIEHYINQEAGTLYAAVKLLA